MNIEDYKNKVIELFKSGKATDEQWAEMANAVLEASESQYKTTFMIDKQIEECECPECMECVDPDELEMFGGVCETCNENKKKIKSTDVGRRVQQNVMRIRTLEADHEPDGWPAIKMKEVTELCDNLEEMLAMVKVFRGCIETGVLPKYGSSCYKKIIELVGEN